MLSRFGLRQVLCGLLFLCAGVPASVAQNVAPDLMQDAATFVATARPTTGLFTVVALRVEFKPDTTRFTTGDGTFATDPFDGLTAAVDPLPHDAAYFTAHLEGLADYVLKVSDGQAQVRTVLLPEPVRVSKSMADYTPTGLDATSDEQLTRLAALVREAWPLAEQQAFAALPADLETERTFFVLLHAGIGRDIELVGTTLDKTPLDIPSIYFDQGALDRLGAPGLTLAGVPVTNTALIPRTESRLGFDFIADEPFLVELTTNGLLAASFFNFLGVPDLFNTVTGESAIGPFGLMDPLGIFAYNGLIPPEPSAWTKVFLGWVAPVEIRSGLPVEVSVRAASTETSDIARVWISDSEYFLVENRHRDVASDGLVMRVWNDGVVTERRVANGDPDFNGVDVSGFSGGVVVGVDDYDWALPGGLDENDNPLLGGILIWHIDERRIRERIGTNSVNADPRRRGVDLEEADSGQDLGFPSSGFFGPALDQGSPFDFFYQGNPVTVITSSGSEVRLYENRFGDDTYPDSRSNGGGPSFIEIADFTAPGPEMSFIVRRAPGGSARPVDAASFSLSGEGLDDLTVTADAGIKWCEDAGTPFYAVPLATGEGARSILFADDEGFISVYDGLPLAPAQPACWESALLAVAIDNESLALVEVDPRSGSTRILSLGLSPSEWVASSQILVRGPRACVALASGDTGLLAFIDLSAGTVQTVDLPSRPYGLAVAGSEGTAVGMDGLVRVVEEDGAVVGEWNLASVGLTTPYELAFGIDADGLLGVAANSLGLALLYPGGVVERVDMGEGEVQARPVLDDVDDDGRLDVLLPVGDRISAITRGSAVASGFPVRFGSPVRAQVLTAAKSTVESGPWVVAVTDGGYVFAVDLANRGRTVAGFPLAASAAGTPAWREGRLYTASASGDFRVWELDGLGTPRWRELYGDSGNQSFVQIESSDPLPTGTALLVSSETYNWPNPVADGETHFRVATTEDASLDVTIVDMAGTRVDQLRAPLVRSGAPFEILWRTDAQSGYYIARVTATASSGRAESRLIRFAIIR